MNPFLPGDIQIETERLGLRPIGSQDSDAIFALFGNWSVARFLSVPPWPYERDGARSHVEGVVKGTGNDPERAFAIRLGPRPRNGTFPHTNTLLTRDHFETLAR